MWDPRQNTSLTTWDTNRHWVWDPRQHFNMEEEYSAVSQQNASVCWAARTFYGGDREETSYFLCSMHSANVLEVNQHCGHTWSDLTSTEPELDNKIWIQWRSLEIGEREVAVIMNILGDFPGAEATWIINVVRFSGEDLIVLLTFLKWVFRQSNTQGMVILMCWQLVVYVLRRAINDKWLYWWCVSI